MESDNFIDTIKAGFFQFPTNLGVSGEVFSSGKTQIIHDTRKIQNWNSIVDNRSTQSIIKNAIYAPLRTVRDKVIGVIQLLNKNTGKIV